MQFVFDQPHAKAINEARLNHLASLGLKLENSTVLEVGAGIGLLTGFFEKLGCTILSTEARETNVEGHSRRYPHRRVELADLSKSGNHDRFGEFDIVFCYGTLYHLSNPALAIQDLSKACRALLLLETCVYPIDNGSINSIKEPESALDQSFEGIGCRPARNWVLSELRKHFPYAYVTGSQPDHPDFPLNWPVLQKNRLTRSVFVASQKPLDMPILLQDLPNNQIVSASLQSSTKFETHLPPKKTEGILIDNFRVALDPRSTEIGGSWQGIRRDGVSTAWDMETIKFFYERTLDIENPIILDVGANTGPFCLLARINQSIKCLAFEPMPMIYEILKKNILLNKLQYNVKALPIALSNKKGSEVLKYPKSGTDSGFACLGKPIRLDNLTEIEVSVNTLDQVAIEEGIKKVDLIKIDTEGCELFVLKGGESLIREYHPGILIKYYEANTQQFGYSAEIIRELLSSWGYDSKKISSEDIYFYKPKAKKIPLMSPKTSIPGTITNGEGDFHEWITKIATAQNRLYYRDQTPESLKDLVKLVEQYKPTKIVELGTLSGLSLRTWLSTDTDAEIIALDLSFEALRQSQQIIPVDLSKVKLLEQNILQIDFTRLWENEDRVLLYVDAHDQENVPIMEHVLCNALPSLPLGSVVVVDDLWYSPEKLTLENVCSFFDNTVLKQIDPLQCFEGYYAPYWEGGCFFGFLEVRPLMEWVNKNAVTLSFKQGIKAVAFKKTSNKYSNTGKNKKLFYEQTGGYEYNPLDTDFCKKNEYHPNGGKASELFKEGVRLYQTGHFHLSINCFKMTAEINAFQSGVYYAQAVILSRFGQFKVAKANLIKELGIPNPHPNTSKLLNDLRSWEISKRKITNKNNYQVPGRFTIFAVPKPFKGHNAIIQKNAIKSWKLLDSKPKIILFGNEYGIKEIANELNVHHVSKIDKNEFGTPLINSIFNQAQKISDSDVLVYVNSDIILFNDFANSLYQVKDHFSNFLMIGRRLDLDLNTEINFSNPEWEKQLRQLAKSKGKLHEPTGIDYFAFTKGVYDEIPPFAIGRTMWDNWLVYYPLNKKIPVIDATLSGSIIHQNHSYGHLMGGEEEAFRGKEAQQNLIIGGGYKNVRTIEHATWQLNNNKLVRFETESCDETSGNRRSTGNRRFTSRNSLLKSKRNLRFLQIHTFYGDYITTLYLKNQNLMHKSFDEQIALILQDGFSSIHIFAPYMNALSFESQFIIANNPYSQQQWLRENNVQLRSDTNRMLQIVREQIDRIKPEVLYLTDPITFESEFIRSLSWKPKLVLGWRAANIPAGTDWSEFDVILSSLTGIRNMALKLGAKSVEHFFPGFPDWVNDYVRDVNPDFDVVFSGTWSSNQHPQRNRYLNAIADEAAQGRRGFTCGFYINGQNEILPANVSKYNLGPRFGIAMHQALLSGRIVIDGRGILELKDPSLVQNIDLAEKQTANMRLFEATGSGSFLLTEYYDNLQDYFQPGVEIETFGDEKELIEKIYYYLDNPEKRKTIASRGQKRCLGEYSMEKRAAEFDHIIQKHLRLKYPAKLSTENSTLEIKAQAEKLIKRDNISAAFQLIIKAKSLKVPTYGLDYLRALCFIHMNSHGNALEALREELRLFPSNPEAKILFDSLSTLKQRPDNAINDSEFNYILTIIKPYTLLSNQRLYSLFTHAKQVCENDIPGNFVECGVAAGGSTALLAYVIKSKSKRPRKIYAFDSFEGMPAPTDADTHQGIPAEKTGWGSGTCYATEKSVREICKALKVSDIVEPVKGYFQETLPDTKNQIGTVALLHMDGDWYDSTRVILAYLYDNVTTNGFIQVDDYGHWEGCQKAVKEFEAARNICFEIFPIDGTGVWFEKPEL